MGQGFSITTLPAGSAGLDAPEMADLSYDKSLGKSRFMKCIKARHKHGLVIAKVVMKPYSSFELRKYVRIMAAERARLADVPNALGYHRIVETSTCGYLVRQFINSSLYDRMSTRPFLENIEKKWIAFQLLCAVRDCHVRDIYHGDIKAENVLVTSWNWLYLTDFSSSFKPTYLPEDNPADFSFYFDTSASDSRDRTCYIAPERFLAAGEDPNHKSPINWAMDIFSVGCLIGELFTDRKFFSLNGILNYRLSKGAPIENPLLKSISDPEIREMVAHMIQVDPEERYTAEEYLTFWKHKSFPEYFYSFLHSYMNLITDPSSGQALLTSGSENLGESDDRIDRVYTDFDKIAYSLGYPDIQITQRLPLSENDVFPLEIDIPDNRHQASRSVKRPPDDGSLIFLTIVVSSLKYCAKASSKVRGCELLLAFAERVPDEAKLDRILPYLIQLLHDDSDMVKVAGLRTITQVLALVSVLRLDNAFVFPEYLLRAFQQFVTTSEKKRQSPWVRATYATCLGSLASTASRYLDIVQTEPSNESTISESQYQNLYDVARLDLIEQFENHTKALLTDTDPSVRRALLPSVSTLCVFFGKAKASYVILSYLNTYINDRDWMLKSAFFEAIVGVATYMGTAVLEEFILPLMVQALTDPEEFVVERVIRSFSSIADLGIFQASTIWELIDTVARFTMHPNMNIREAATHFIAASARFASIADQSCIIAPLIKDYLKVQPASLSEVYLLEVLKRPLPRNIMNLAAHWVVNSRKSLFWKGVEQQKVFTFGFGENVTLPPRKRSTIKALARMPKNEQDEHEIENLRKGGLVSEDEFKLLALQEYIWRTTHRKALEELLKQEDLFSDINTITSLGLEPQTIIFENKQTADRVAAWDLDHPTESRTIADAIQDATSTDVAPKAQRTLSVQSAKPTDIPNMKKSTDAADIMRSPTNKTIDRLQEGSSFDSKRSLTINDQQIQKKGSAMSLMGLRESASKAAADTSTDTTNAFGKVDRTHSRDDMKKKPLPFVNGKRIKPVHSYTGNDPNVLRLLDSLYLDQYPIDVIEFGQVIPAPRGEPLRRGGTNPHRGLWQPEGTLVAMLGEHKAGINRVIVSPDHKFFITASDDGTVKVWDVGRLERTVHHRAKNTHIQGTNVRVTSLAFVDNTHCFISTGSDGSVHLVRVECSDKNTPSGGGMQYGRLYMVREYQLPEGEFAVWSEHYKQDIRSMMILATNKSNIYAVDLRTMEVVYQLRNPMNHGTPTCFCVDREGHWLLLGTSHGVLDLWDLRFKLRVRSWGFAHGSPIHRILPPLRTSTSTSKKSRVMIAGGAPGTITVLDIEKNLLREVYQTALPTAPHPSSSDASPTPKKHHSAKPHTDLPVLVDLDAPDNQPGGVLSRFRGSSIAMDGGRSAAAGATAGAQDFVVRAIAMGAHIHDTGTEPRYTYILSAGPDWKVRFWDAKWPEQSCVVSGLESDEGVPSFHAQTMGETSVVVEEVGKAIPGGSDPLVATRTPEGKKKKEKGSVVSLQQQSLLRGHKDAVMDVAVVEVPYGMVVSVDRAGMVYVWA